MLLLPKELVFTIFQNLEIDDPALIMSRTCKKFKRMSKLYYKEKVYKDYSKYIHSSIPSTVSSWHKLYTIYDEAHDPSNIFSLLTKVSDDLPNDILNFITLEYYTVKEKIDPLDLYFLSMRGGNIPPIFTLYLYNDLRTLNYAGQIIKYGSKFSNQFLDNK